MQDQPSHFQVGTTSSPAPDLEEALSFLDSHPDWDDPNGMVTVAPLEPETNPLCILADGERHEDLRSKYKNWDHSHRYRGEFVPCLCYAFPYAWTVSNEIDRIAEGDNGEERIPFSVTAEQWLRANPCTTKQIFGEEIGSAFLGLSLDGMPLPPIPLQAAGERYKELVFNDPIGRFEKLSQEGADLYRQRQDPEKLSQAVAAFEKCAAMSEEVASCYLRNQESGTMLPWGEPLQQLAIIYEKEGRISEAIAICQKVQSEGWGGDWSQRIARLNKKL